MQMPEMPLIKFIDGWETVAEMEAALGIPEGNLVATLDRYNEHAARGEDPDFHKQPEYVAAQDKGPWAAFDLSLGVAMYSGFTMGGLAVIDRRRGAAARTAALSPACTPRGPARRTSPRTARATPAAHSWARARSSAAAPAAHAAASARRAPAATGRRRAVPGAGRGAGRQRRAVADADHDAVRQRGRAATRYSANSWPSSSAEVDSSRNTAFGFASSTRANAMRCCSPGESTLAQSFDLVEPARPDARGRPCPAPTGSRRRRVARDRPGRRSPPAGRPAARTAAATGTWCRPAGRRNVPDVNGHSCARLRSRVVLPRARAAGDHQSSRPRRAGRRAGRSAVLRRRADLDLVELDRAVGARLGRQRR